MNGKRFVGDFFVVQLLNFIVKPFWLLVIDREVQNRLPQGEYGNYFSLLSLVLLFSVVLDPGLNNYQSSFYAKHPLLWASGFRKSIRIKAFLSIPFIGLVMIAGLISGITIENIMLLVGVAAIQLLSGWILHFRSFLNAKRLFRKDGLTAASDKLLAGLFLALVLYGFIDLEISVRLFVFVQALSLFLVALILFFALYAMSHERQDSDHLDEFRLRSVLSRTWPYALLSILMIAYTRSDAIMLRWMHPEGAAQVDVYAMSFRLLDAAVMIPALLAGMLLPTFSGLLNRMENLEEHVSQSLAILLFPAIALAAIFTLYSEPIGWLLYPGKFDQQATFCMNWLLPTFIPMCLVYIFGTLLTAASELKKLNILGTITLICNIGLNALLIPGLGAKGAAIATLSTQSIFALGCIFLSRQVSGQFIFQKWLKENAIQLIVFFVSILLVQRFAEGLFATLILILVSILCSGYLWLKYSGALFRKGI